MERPNGSLEKPVVPGIGGGLIITLFSMVLATLVSQVVLLACGGPGIIRYTDSGLAPYPFVLLALCSAAGFLTVSALLGALIRRRVNLSFHPGDLVPASVALVAVFLVNMAGTALGHWFGEEYRGAPDLSAGGTATFGIAVAAILLAPAVEELFFREMLLTRVLAGAPRWLSIAATGSAFGAFHLSAGGPALVLTLALMGVVLAWLRFRTGSRAAPFLVHAANNAIALAFLS